MELTKADRAALLRGTSPWEVPGFYRLLHHYGAKEKGPAYEHALELAAPLLAEVREDDTTVLGKACRRAGVNERQLRRVLAARDRQDLVHQLRRVVRLLGRKANKDELVQTVVYWGDHRRRRLAQGYFGAREDEDDDAA